MATLIAPSPTIKSDDRFFLISSIVMAIVIVAGFSTQFAMGRSTFGAPLIVHIHAVAFMGWVALYVTQTAFAATGSMALHRRLGWIGAGWMAAMVPLGIAVTVLMARRGQTPFFFQPAYFLIMNPLSVLCFAGLTTAAIVKRRETGWHRRLHFCGMSVLLGPAFGRLLPMPFLPPYAGDVVFASLMLFPIAGVVADLRRSGRVHPAWWWGIGTLLATHLAITVLTFSPIGPAIYAAVTAGSPGAALSPLEFPPPPPDPLITGR